jgi:2,4-dienoyl-CoA reductase-like NADH-dependent reductase (Old Yellow Enzyme family)/thioredoxin reductase
MWFYMNKSAFMTYSTTKDPLFQPLKIRGLTLKNRVMSTSHASGMDDANMPATRYQRYHEEKAKGGMALTMFGGSSNVAPDSPSIFEQLDVSDDRVIPYFKEFSERIHQHGTALMCQISHLGRRGDAQAGHWLPAIGPSAVRETVHRNFPREMDRYDIDRVVKAYGQAAKRCFEGGLDGLETLANSHLIGQFLSPVTNLRTDEFGGSVENRTRFSLMVHDEIRRQVGDGFVVGIRLVVDEGKGGLRLDEVVQMSELMKSAGTVDFFNCSVGRMDTEISLAEETMPGMSRPLAPYLDIVGQFRREIGMPVFHAARVTDVATARHAIRDGILDMVAMTRAHIADPQIVNKIAKGEEDRIRPCIGASHCIYKKIHCIHNAVSGRETLLPMDVPRADVPDKKVVVVGGGPAGLEAARVSAERGHQVVLFEAAAKLGGQVQLAAKASWRHDLISIVDWREAELGHLGVDVRMNVYAEVSDVLAENPDYVFVATGGMPVEQSYTSAGLAITSWDILSGDVKPAQEVLICDGTGRYEAISCADHLSALGHKVTLATIDDRAGTEMGYTDRAVFRKRLYEQGVETLPDLRISAIERDGNRLIAIFANELTGQSRQVEADQVVVEVGTQPLADMFFELQSRSKNNGVSDVDAMARYEAQAEPAGAGFMLHRIGDALTSRSIHAAILEAYRIAVRI